MNAEPVETRFLFDGACGLVLDDALQTDLSAARLSSLYRAYYQLRPWMPLKLRQLLQRHRTVDAPQQWYIPSTTSHDLQAALRATNKPQTIIHPWPDGADWAAVLTHDVETSDGLRHALDLAVIEAEFGFRSSWNIVPYGYKVDSGVIRELRARGCEIGIHGYNHDGRLFTSHQLFQRRAVAINAALQEYDAVGFRSPMVHRNLQWLQALNVQYDASWFDADPFQAMPGGMGSIWPFMAGRFVELPYTMPQDHTVLVVLRETTGRIWHEKLDFIVRHHGLALLLTHPDYLTTPGSLDLYRGTLARMCEIGRYWHALPRDVANWWRLRDESQLRRDPDGSWQITGPATHAGSVAHFRSDGRAIKIERQRADTSCENPTQG